MFGGSARRPVPGILMAVLRVRRHFYDRVQDGVDSGVVLQCYHIFLIRSQRPAGFAAAIVIGIHAADALHIWSRAPFKGSRVLPSAAC